MSLITAPILRYVFDMCGAYRYGNGRYDSWYGGYHGEEAAVIYGYRWHPVHLGYVVIRLRLHHHVTWTALQHRRSDVLGMENIIKSHEI